MGLEPAGGHPDQGARGRGGVGCFPCRSGYVASRWPRARASFTLVHAQTDDFETAVTGLDVHVVHLLGDVTIERSRLFLAAGFSRGPSPGGVYNPWYRWYNGAVWWRRSTRHEIGGGGAVSSACSTLALLVAAVAAPVMYLLALARCGSSSSMDVPRWW